ncbi:hypothetical protein AB0H73_00160 [Streptomyces olivoreticuli]
METYKTRRAVRSATGHYRKPGTNKSYCGHDLAHTPTEPQFLQAICKTCVKAEKRNRVEAEQVATNRTIDGPSLAKRASVRYATVGTGRRIHYSPKHRSARAASPAEQAVERRAVEGVIVAHNGRTRGTAPKHSDHPDALAALTALANLKLAEVTDRTDVGAMPGSVDHDPEVRGVLVVPRDEGRVAVYWTEGGQWITPTRDPWVVELQIIADKLRKAGWLIEPNSRRCVFARRRTQ